jgi:hypothetical protein
MAILAQLDLSESAKLDFGVEISGTENKALTARFIIEGPEYGIVCKCIEESGQLTAEVPKLNGILPSGIYSARLEIIIDGKYFQPLTENIQFNAPVTVGVTSSTATKNAPVIQTHGVQVRVSEEKITVKAKTHDEIKASSFTNYVSESKELDAKKRKLVEMQRKIVEAEEKLNKMKNR